MVFVLGTLAGWISGYMGMRHVRRILDKAERTINNVQLPISKKYVAAVQAVHSSCDYLGRVMDDYNLEQGTAPYLKTLEKEIEQKLNGGEKKDGSLG